MSEFKSGDEFIDDNGNDLLFIGLSPKNPDFGYFLDHRNGCVSRFMGNVKPKPKTITVEIPKPKHIVRRHTSIEVYLKSVSDAEKAYSSLTAIIYPKGVE